MQTEINHTIDFHAHILPKADHGSDSVETSLFQLEQATSAGITDIVASSHFYPHLCSIEQFCENREQAYLALKRSLSSEHPNILLASEAQFCEGFQRIDGIERLCIQNTNTLLIEMPRYELSEDALDGLCELKESKGINVVIAHPERYNRKLVSTLIGYDFLFQLNVGGICSLRTRKFCTDMIEKNNVVAIGTDIHGRGSNYKEYIKAVKRLGIKAHCIQKSAFALLKGNVL